MMRGCIASLVLLMILMTGCSAPWYPYPYVNPQVNDTARRGKTQPEAPVEDEYVAPSSQMQGGQADVPETSEPAVEADTSETSASDAQDTVPADLFEDPSFPNDTNTIQGNVPAPYSK